MVKWFGSTLFNDDVINAAKGFTYSNEAWGCITDKDNGTKISLYWVDIKLSDNYQQGFLNLYVDPSGSKMVKLSATGGFGPSEWTRKY